MIIDTRFGDQVRRHEANQPAGLATEAAPIYDQLPPAHTHLGGQRRYRITVDYLNLTGDYSAPDPESAWALFRAQFNILSCDAPARIVDITGQNKNFTVSCGGA